jgi:23S rRNA pseudouridine1911/1915/1917 synthase
LVGDPLYRRGLPGRTSNAGSWQGFPRQALHACRLELVHPASGQTVGWFRAPPSDLAALMRGLEFRPLDRPSSVFERES